MPPTLALLAALALAETRPFAITVVDDRTGRGVPLVELKTVNDIRYVTDSAGVAAVDEPGLMGLSVFFQLKGHGYEFPKDGFGYRGKALKLTPGGSATLKIRRVNIAERIYRTTGGGIYRDTVLVGRTPPTRAPVLNGQVLGQDSVLMTPYRGKLYWFWGDTNRPGYPLGNFHTPGATSEPPGKGGLDPDVGVDLSYFVDETGFARPAAKLPGEGPTWLGGLAVIDDGGREVMVAGYSKIKPPMEAYEHGLVTFDPDTNEFRKAATFPFKAPVRPAGHTLVRKEGGETFIYYTTPFPLTRVRARLADLKDATKYEAFTCLKEGSRLDKPEFDRGPDGRLRYAWRANTPPVAPGDQFRLVREGTLKADEALIGLRDVETGKPVLAHGGTVAYNAYRGRWVMIAVELFGGPSMLGEVWYAEAPRPLGPWAYARKVATHDKYSFYNPKHHPEFDRDGGRVIYFEGTYTTSFSGNTDPTPRYEYNQVMYRLDLSDPRLVLPEPVYILTEGDIAMGPLAPAVVGGAPPDFYALARPGEGTTPVLSGIGPPLFHALPADATRAREATLPLYDVPTPGAKGVPRRLTTRAPEGARPVGRVWPTPSWVRLPAEAVE